MSIDALIGLSDNGDSDACRDIKQGLAKKLRQASQLPPHEIKTLSTFIDTLIIKQRVNTDNTGAQQNEA